MLQKLRHIAFLAFLLLWELPGLFAQCTQCKSAASARDEAGNLYIGASMNVGILYLLVLPFLAVLIVGGYWFYRNYRLSQESHPS